MKNISILLFLTFILSSESMSEDKDVYFHTNSNKNTTPTCETNGGFAGDEGLKTWCWTGDLANDVNNTTSNLGFFSGSQLAKSAHYYGGSVFAQGGRLNFSVNPTNPSPPSGSKYNYNYRAEIRDSPSSVDHQVGTEQWWGFDYKFGEDYVSDKLPWVLWQTHGSFRQPSNPMTSLQISPANFVGSNSHQGELIVANSVLSTGSTKVSRTGIVPSAGQTLKIVVHLIWGDNNKGLYQVWVDDVLVYNEQERTVYVEQPEGGYWKIGIYKWRWQQQSNVNLSAGLGINQLNSSIGNLRVIKKSPSNPTYLADEYDKVKPRILLDDPSTLQPALVYLYFSGTILQEIDK